ncbi:hypothetical protein BAE44_0004045 [Dichanthelium oligosanthes]|uniref:RING-type domain-containing protein n=1 Tax=Dichanthelium oligosanthes TaxID=888268 RepID=A0A1E5WC18_9POAL|nr:hypothetical protein BAE44_0004045 [Dichanthelium oligosanthes]
MEEQQPRPDHVQDIELEPDNDAAQRSAVDVNPHPTCEIAADCHVVDMELLQIASVAVDNPAGNTECHVPDAAETRGANREGDDGSGCCVVCTEPLEWVVVGRCGHRVVCSRCTVRIRFFRQNKRCCICRTRCPKVLVARWDAAAASRDAGNLSALPWFAFRQGRVRQVLLFFLWVFGSALLIGAAMVVPIQSLRFDHIWCILVGYHHLVDPEVLSRSSPCGKLS